MPLIDELLGESEELTRMAHENARTLAELWAEHTATAPTALPPDVLEIATLQAHEAGMAVADWLRDAVLAHAAGPARAADPSTPEARAQAAGAARRVRAESSALLAQSAQARRRAAALEPRATPDAAP